MSQSTNSCGGLICKGDYHSWFSCPQVIKQRNEELELFDAQRKPAVEEIKDKEQEQKAYEYIGKIKSKWNQEWYDKETGYKKIGNIRTKKSVWKDCSFDAIKIGPYHVVMIGNYSPTDVTIYSEVKKDDVIKYKVTIPDLIIETDTFAFLGFKYLTYLIALFLNGLVKDISLEEFIIFAVNIKPYYISDGSNAIKFYDSMKKYFDIDIDVDVDVDTDIDIP